MKRIVCLAVAVFAFTGADAFAQSGNTEDTQVQVAPGHAQYSANMRREAIVSSIDYKARAVSLRMPDGEVVALTVGPEMKNLDRVKVGDTVVADYQEFVELTLLKNGKQPVGQQQLTDSATAAKGENPSAHATNRIVLTGDVVKVDQATGVVTLRGKTALVDLTVHDPSQLALIKVGDQVQAVGIQTLALSLRPVKVN